MNSFHEHIQQYSAYFGEIRRRVMVLIKIFGISFFFGFVIAGPLIRFFVKNLAIQNVTVVTSSPFQLLDLSMSIGFFFSIVVVTPFVIYQMYAFLRPGLLAFERRVFLSLIPVGVFLFFLGFMYGFITLYLAMRMIAQVNITLGVVNYWDIGRFASEIVLTSSFLGIAFEFPIIITFLVKIGLLSVDFLRTKRKHAAVIIFIFVSLLPPTDGLSLILMAVPLVAIYEITVLLNSRNKVRRILLN